MNGGPIGGNNQTGNYKIDARFNRKTLLDRLRLIRLYSSAIEVQDRDGLAVIDQYAGMQECLIYADPPYFLKAGSLYMNSFRDEDHERLADHLNLRAGTSNWILTYDNYIRVHELYQERRRSEIGVHYSARSVMKAKELLVVSDKLVLEPASLWDHDAETTVARSEQNGCGASHS